VGARHEGIEGEVRLNALAWSRTSTAPNQALDPGQLATLALAWENAADPPRDFDDRDWWYRTSFERTDEDVLHFKGLATLAQVWLNGALILESNNMFEEHRVDVGALLQSQNELLICFRSLNAALGQRRPRPRWKTKLVNHQQLRWFRTTLLGRIPGWTSPWMTPVGLWRPVVFGNRREIDLHAYVDGTTGVVEVSCNSPGTLHVGAASATLQAVDDGRWLATVRIEDVSLWWPHTHGEPALYPCTVEIVEQSIDCGRVGFRTIERRDEFELLVNGVAVFCRGASWTGGTIADLELLRDAGANMVRISGTMVYETDAFYRACDELGLLVWQDFMFANMDYPADDPPFVATVDREVIQQLRRLRRHPSVVVYCGNSEVEQQAAMVGAPREIWRNALFAEVIPGLREQWHPDTVHVPSTPSGGTMPFHTGTGVTHYYGVGAYLRPLTDARRANVQFTPECLAFSNVPEEDFDDPKRGVPRDSGADWDFADVRNHYVRELFGAEAAERLDVGRVATGEVMAQVFSEWRSARSSCHGALVWFLKDLEPGAGWGILDSRGVPKACFFYLRRVWQPRTVVLTDEGLDGIHAHVVNESTEPLVATLEIVLLRDGHVVTARGSVTCDVAPRSTMTYEADAILGAFYDTTYAYRFGPPGHDVAVATLLDERGNAIAEAFHFPLRPELKWVEANVVVEARGNEVTLSTDRFLYAVHFDTVSALPEDNYFHLVPGRAKTVQLRGSVGGFVEALNLEHAVRIVVKE
jgi:beta-mannosidase